MNLRKQVVFSFLPLVVLACSFAVLAKGDSQKIALEEVLAVGSLEADDVFQWVGIHVDDKGNIYVTDSLDYSVKKFDRQGRLLFKAGREGHGPGEFLAPRLIDGFGNFIFITDQSLPGIQVFDKNLNFVKKIPFPLPIIDFRVVDDGQIAVASISFEKKRKILLVDHGGKKRSEIVYSSEEFQAMMDMVSFDLDSSGNLYIAYLFLDRVEKFDREGKKIWSQKLFGSRKVGEKKASTFEVPSEIVYKDVCVDHAGQLYVLGGSFSKNPSRDVYILGTRGELQGTITLSEPTHCVYIDNQRFLYTRANEGITIKKYRIRENETPDSFLLKGGL